MKLSKWKRTWTRFWTKRSGSGPAGRVAARLATLFTPGFYGRVALSRLTESGFVSPRAEIIHDGFSPGPNCYLDDRVLVYRDQDGGGVAFGAGVHVHRDTTFQTGLDGSVTIGNDTHVQPRCQFSAYKGSIVVGARVEIAPACAFYSYDHGIEPGTPVRDQPLRSRGGIRIGDDVWIGYGVIVLDGVHIGNDAVIGAGSLVNSDVPAGAIAVGSPARVVRQR